MQHNSWLLIRAWDNIKFKFQDHEHSQLSIRFLTKKLLPTFSTKGPPNGSGNVQTATNLWYSGLGGSKRRVGYLQNLTMFSYMQKSQVITQKVEDSNSKLDLNSMPVRPGKADLDLITRTE